MKGKNALTLLAGLVIVPLLMVGSVYAQDYSVTLGLDETSSTTIVGTGSHRYLSQFQTRITCAHTCVQRAHDGQNNYFTHSKEFPVDTTATTRADQQISTEALDLTNNTLTRTVTYFDGEWDDNTATISLWYPYNP